jgi:hypothetical protein
MVSLVSSGNCSRPTGLIRPLVAALAGATVLARDLAALLAQRLLSLLKTVKCRKIYRFSRAMPIPSGMITILSALVSMLPFRFRTRASPELEVVALRHQVIVLRRQRPRRARLFSTDRLLWIWLCRVRPQILDTFVLVKPATVVK